MILKNLSKMKIINLLFSVLCYLAINSSPVYAEAQCFDSLPSDSSFFGNILAAENKYLVVGDPGANRVIIYTRELDDKWLRTREILPPKNSTAYKVGSGFGSTIALDGDHLVIGSFTVIKPENTKAVNPQDFHENNGIFSSSTALYLTRINEEAEVKRINFPDIPKNGVLPTGKVMAEDGKISFIFSQQQPGKRIKRINQIYLLSNGKNHALPSGKLEYEIKTKVGSINIYGIDIDLKNSLLIVSIDRDQNKGGVWLFNLDSPQSKPKKIDLPFIKPAKVSVAISDQFIAISNTPKSYLSHLFEQSGITLIRNIATGSTIITEGVGHLSLDKNILVRIRSIPNGRENQTVDEIPRTAEVFMLDDDATPKLFQTLNDVRSAIVQNGLLISVRKTVFGKEVCTEQVY